MSIPTPGELVSSFITEYGTTPGVKKDIIDNLAAFGTTRPAFVNQYHAAYEAALEASVNDKISSTVSSVFTFGKILDLTDSTGDPTNDPPSIVNETYASPGGTAFDISKVVGFPTTAGALNVGTYYKLNFVGGGSQQYIVKLNSDDAEPLVVQNGDAVVIYQADGYKTLDKFDNVQTSITAGDSDYITVEQGSGTSNFTVSLATGVIDTVGAAITTLTGAASQITVTPGAAHEVGLSLDAAVTDALALIDTTESADTIRSSVNSTLSGIIGRLQTVTSFMSFMESTGLLFDASGAPVTFSNAMNLSTVPTELTLDSGVVEIPAVVSYTTTPLSSTSVYIGDTVSLDITDLSVPSPQTISSVDFSIDGGATYSTLAGSSGTYATEIAITSNTAGTRVVKIKVTTSTSAVHIINYGSFVVNVATLKTLGGGFISGGVSDSVDITGPIGLFRADDTLITDAGDFIQQVGLIGSDDSKQFFTFAELSVGVFVFLDTATGTYSQPGLTWTPSTTYSLFVSNGSGGSGDTVRIVSSTLTASAV